MMKSVFKFTLMGCVLAAAWFGVEPYIKSSNNDEIVSAKTVIEKVNALNRLESSEYLVQTIIETEKDGTLAYLYQDSQKGLFVVHGRVSAGVDLSQAKVSEGQGKITISLPHPEIFTVNFEHIKIYDLQTGSLNIINPDHSVLDEVQKRAKIELLKQACAGKILDHAQTQAIESLKAMFAFADSRVSIMPQRSLGRGCAAPKPKTE